jgi:methionyl-tRNA formyltransferase
VKRLGVLVIGRDYFTPYVEWLASMDGALFDVVGYIDNDARAYADIPGYGAKRDRLTLEEMAAASDMILSLGYWKIVPGDLLRQVPLGILNLHHSYLLKYRGRHGATWAILNQERVHGTTLHFMSEALDDGPIVAARAVPVLPEDTAYSLFSRVNAAGLDMLKENLPLALTSGKGTEGLRPDPNPVSHRARDMTHELSVELMDDGEGFVRNIRARTFPGMPRPYIMVAGTKVYLTTENP